MKVHRDAQEQFAAWQEEQAVESLEAEAEREQRDRDCMETFERDARIAKADLKDDIDRQACDRMWSPAEWLEAALATGAFIRDDLDTEYRQRLSYELYNYGPEYEDSYSELMQRIHPL